MFGLFPWDAIPIIPPEFIFLPPQSPVNIYRLASWARGCMVPLFIIFHHKPIFALPNGKSENNNWLDHLWLNPSQKKVPYSAPLIEVIKKNKISWKSFFVVADKVLHFYERFKPKKLREYALKNVKNGY
jgi:squalene-hopene/tetraprenyl-beta-curcumene cyclase